jgi:Spy/CpxP family protein refolding chaperone
MESKNTYRILIWVIVILAATSLSMGLSFWYNKQQDKKTAEQKEQQIEMPSEQRTRFFREQLSLRPDQMDIFRDLNRDYNRSARRISSQLEESRIKMVNEMGKKILDRNKLDSISENIGKLHTELKKVTIQYYLDMKEVCDENQQKKLNEIFMSMSKSKEDVSLPQRGRRSRGRQIN